jgi:hypothetical protein
MPQYLLAMYQPDGVVPPPEVLEPVMAELGKLRAELQDQGKWVFGNGLHDASTATVVRPENGKVLTTDGPYTEGHEHIGGITIVEAEDLDEALAISARMATCTGQPMEVRPFYG